MNGLNKRIAAGNDWIGLCPLHAADGGTCLFFVVSKISVFVTCYEAKPGVFLNMLDIFFF